MKTAFIIHGSYGHPEENWFPWLKQELEKLDYKVFVPKFPTPKDQSLNNWLNIFKGYKKHLNKNSIVIGHSIGPAFLLTILENQPVKAAFFVSGFIGSFKGKYANHALDKINKTFAEKEFDWKKIKNNCKTFTLFHSDNDPYVSLDKAIELQNKLDAELIIIKNAGHFNQFAGYTRFPELLEKTRLSSAL